MKCNQRLDELGCPRAGGTTAYGARASSGRVSQPTNGCLAYNGMQLAPFETGETEPHSTLYTLTVEKTGVYLCGCANEQKMFHKKCSFALLFLLPCAECQRKWGDVGNLPQSSGGARNPRSYPLHCLCGNCQRQVFWRPGGRATVTGQAVQHRVAVFDVGCKRSGFPG